MKNTNTKKITVWISASWDHQGYQAEIDTDIPLNEWENMSTEEREEICNELAKEELSTIILSL